jgi:hypothetical protein
MDQLAQATAQAVANLAQRIGVGELAEQHRDQLRPAAKAFGTPFGVVFLDQRRELGPREMLEQLIEETRNLYDGFAFLVGAFGEAPAWNDSPTFIIGGLFFCSQESQACFGQE